MAALLVLFFFFYNFSNFQRFHFQNPWTEVRQDTKGVKWPFVICKWCIFHWRWTSHHQCFVWWHSQGTVSKWYGCAANSAIFNYFIIFFAFMSYFRFGARNPANASTHSNLCPGHQKSPSTMWFPCPKIQSTLWFVTTRTRWSSWTSMVRWELSDVLIWSKEHQVISFWDYLHLQ